MSKLLKKIFIILTLVGFKYQDVVAATGPQGFADLVEPLFPAVVNISTTQKLSKNAIPQRQMPMPFPEGSPFEDFNQFFEKFSPYGPGEESDPKSKAISLGSGFIVDPKGLIVTNHHVIAEADEITVTLSSGKQLKATVVGSDKRTDLSLLKVAHDKDLPSVKFGDSDKARVGDWVIAIGNPFGLGGTVTAGIISAHDRDIHPDGLVDNFIQTDAAINRGNSGGPMFNMNGEVIGISTAILSPSGVYIGIGFATPSSVAQLVIEQIKTKGSVERGILGIKIQQMSEDIADSLNLKTNEGALVAEVMKDSAAQKAGIKVGDVITEFNGQKIDNIRKLSRIVAESSLDKGLIVKLIRNGEQKTIEVKLIKDIDDISEKEDIKEELNSKNILGGDIAPLSARLRGKYNIPSDIQGLILVSVPKKSTWYKKGFIPGDVLISANQKLILNPVDLEQMIKQTKVHKKKSILLLVYRQGQNLFIPLAVD